MNLSPVESSNITACGYDPDKKELHVQFGSGQTYIYEGVPKHVHEALVAAKSVGSHFSSFIRNSGYKFRKA